MAKQPTAAARRDDDKRDAAANTRKGPVATVAGETATGNKVRRVIGPGNLFIGGKAPLQRAVITTNNAVYVGRMVGVAYSVRRHPNAIEATKESLCFAGDFISTLSDGSVIQTLEAYLPSSVERAFAGMLESRATPSVSFALELWAVPDEPGRRPTATGYTYVAYDMLADKRPSAAAMLAEDAGVIMPTSRQIEGPKSGGYDPDTGEVVE